MRRQFFLALSQLKISYPDSPLSVGKTGHLHSGQRLPWVKTPEGSNFDALKSLRWQVHVYGAAHAELSDWCIQQGLDLHVFAHTRAAQKEGLAKTAIYLVRPDGYIGLALATFEPADLDSYASRWVNPVP